MKTYEASAKTKEEAIDAGLEALGVSISDVTVEVIDEGSKGLFGLFGSRLAKVRLTVKETEDDPLADLLNDKPAPKPAPAREERQPRPERKPEAPKPEKKHDAPKAPREPKPEKKPAAPKTYAPAPAGSTEEKIEQFLKGLLEHMDSKAVPHCWQDSANTYKVDLVGDDLGYLIGRRGDTLDAIQHLANYTINRDVEGHIRINVDAECYREKREESLRRYARKKAQQVLKARRRTTLEPMNAYERHVIHAALQEMDNITTHSTGVEPNRCVVIEYVR